MCLGGSPSAPPPPPRLPEAPRTPDASASVSSTSEARRKAAVGLSGTILTGARGITETAPTGAKTLLGQ